MNALRTFCLMLVLTASYSATAVSAPDWEKTLKPRNLVWENKDFTEDWQNVGFIGDGQQGASVLLDSEDSNDLRFLLSRYDIVEYPEKGYWPRVFAGNVIITPKGTVQDRTMEQDLYTGVLTGVIRTDAGSIEWKAFAERKASVLVVAVRGQEGERGAKPTYRIERPVDTRRYFTESKYYKERGYDKIEFAPEAKPLREVDGVQVLEQPMSNRGGFGVAFKELQEAGWNYIVVALSADPGEDQNAAICRAAEQSLGRIQQAASLGVGKLEDAHVDWWKRYSRKSYLRIKEDPRWEQLYQVQLYKFASASSENSSYLIDNQGLWPWHCGWAGTWWNLNVQLSYFPMFAANRLDAGRSMINGINRMYKDGSLRANAAHNKWPGITVGRSSDYRGRKDQGWSREFGNLTWVLNNYWKYWQYSGDDRIGRDLFPMLKENIVFLTHFLEKQDDGKLHMQKSRSPEYEDVTGKDEPLREDSNYGLMSLDWALRTAIEMNEELGFSDPAAKDWEKTLAELTPLPVSDETGFMVSGNTEFKHGHRHYSHLLSIYPYHSVNVGQGPDARALIQKSVDNWHSFGGRGSAGYTFTGGCAMYALLGQGDRALELLDQLPGRLKPNSMYREGGGPVIETPLSSVESVNYLLLQSWGGVVRIFPAVPSKWKNVEYRDLRCEGAHLVSAKRVNGRTQSFELTAGGDAEVLVKTDIRDPQCDRALVPVRKDGSFTTYRITMKKGEALKVEAAPLPAYLKGDAYEEPEYAPDARAPKFYDETMKTRDARVQWWADSRFGCFMHWGVYAQHAGVWKGEKISGYSEHIQRKCKIDQVTYAAEFAAKFNPVGFDAEEWVKLIKAAGMRYLVITAKHHDGFAMYDSKVSDWNIMKATPFKRDPMAELKAACVKHGIKFGFYYSHAFDWGEAHGPGNDWEFKNPGGDKLLGGKNWWDDPVMSKELARIRDNYVTTKSIPQVIELLKNYKPDIMWFDTPHKLPNSELWRVFKALRATDSDVIVNGRFIYGFGDYQTTCDKPAEIKPTSERYWEAIPTTNESYGHHAMDDSHKPPAELIQLLVKAVARGGNILMNLGPRADGRIDDPDVDILKAFSDWMAVNSESVHGAGKSGLPVQAWGESTRKDNAIYLQVFDWPENGRLIVGGLKSNPKRAALLTADGEKPLIFARAGTYDLSITVPPSAPNESSSVIALTFDSDPECDKARLLATTQHDNKLHVFDGRLTGRGLRYGSGSASQNHVSNWTQTDCGVEWDVGLAAPATFEVAITYEADRKSGGEYAIRVGQFVCRSDVVQSRGEPIRLGRVTCPAGASTIAVRGSRVSGDELFKLRAVTLRPVQGAAGANDGFKRMEDAEEQRAAPPAPTFSQGKDGALTLRAVDAVLSGGPNIERKAAEPNIGFWTKAEGTASWKLDVQKPGRYAVTLCAAAEGSGNKVAIEAGDARVEWTRQNTGGWEIFKDFEAGSIGLGKGETLLTIKSADGKPPLLNVMSLVLRPAAKQAKVKEAPNPQGRPNIVLILADDLGWNSLGCMGSDYYESPNIDKLAEQGMMFDNGYAACPICAPTRASLMSGWEIPRHKVLRVSDGQLKKIKQGQKITTRLLQPPHQGDLDAEVVTLAEAFKDNGYRTGMFGKWHLGWWKNPDHLPSALGFTDFKMKTAYAHYDTALVPSGVNKDEKIPEGVYLTDYMCDLALDFMEDSTKRKQPFFLYLPDLLVHSPFETIKEELDYFEAKPTGKMHHDAPLAAMVKSLDRTVGRVMEKLKELGIDDNTLVVFTSDNGGVPLDVDGKWWREQKPNTSNGVLKGGKGGLFEGGIRVPYIFRYPGRIPAGTLSREPITTIDLYPTLLSQAGLQPPSNHKLDGTDVSPCLADAKARLPQRALYWFYSNYSFAGRPGMVIREGDWKYGYFFENEEEELYNLAEDIGEEKNLVNEHPERAKTMRRKLEAWATEVKVPPHKPNPDYKPSR